MKPMSYIKHKIGEITFFPTLGEIKMPIQFLHVLFGKPTSNDDFMVHWDVTIEEDGEIPRSYCIMFIFNDLVKNTSDMVKSKPYTFYISGTDSVKKYGTSQLRNYMTSTLIHDGRSKEYINIVMKYLVHNI